MSLVRAQGPTIPGSGNFHDLQVDRLDALIGGGNPAGNDLQIQYNDDGVFGASSAFVFNKDPVDSSLTLHGSNSSYFQSGSLAFTSTSEGNSILNNSPSLFVDGGPSSTGDGGSINLSGGDANISGSGGNVQLVGGDSLVTGDAGNILLIGGTAFSGTGGNITLTAGTGSVLGPTPTPDGSIQLITNLTPLTSSPTPVTVTQGGFSLYKLSGVPVTTATPSTTINSRQGVVTFNDVETPIPPNSGLIIQVFNNTLQPSNLVPFISNDQVMCCISGWTTGGGSPPAFTFPQPTVTIGNINQPSLFFEVNIFNTDTVNSLSSVNILFMLI
jgi:hypothetical protein